MAMRVSNQLMVNNAIQNMQENQERLSRLQQRAATNKRFQNISDAPNLAAEALGLRSALQTHETYMETAHTTNDWLAANEYALTQTKDLLARAQNLVQQGISDTEGPDERQALATEIEGIIRQAVDAANTNHQNKYIFAGFSVTTQPYSYTAGGGSVTNNVANTAGPIQNKISPAETITVNVDGNNLFNTGTDAVFVSLIAARDSLTSGNVTAMQTAVTNLDSAINRIGTARTTNGAWQRNITDTLDRMTVANNAMKNLLSHKEDASLSETATSLQYQQMVYQTSIQVASRTLTSTLFDYLR
jgi:flagellar hook-associated protein 3 FlgL